MEEDARKAALKIPCEEFLIFRAPGGTRTWVECRRRLASAEKTSCCLAQVKISRVFRLFASGCAGVRLGGRAGPDASPPRFAVFHL